MRRLLALLSISVFALSLSACSSCGGGCNKPNPCNKPNTCNKCQKSPCGCAKPAPCSPCGK